jgi:DNA repair protein RecO (recombination protein O)
LLHLQAEEFSDPRTRGEAKQLMRTLMAYYLGGRELETRKIFKELQDL